jgi:hypothetical protein
MTEDLERTEIRTFRTEYWERRYEEALQEGALQHARRTLIRILELVPGGITTTHRQRIEASTDFQELDDWIDVIGRVRTWNALARE